MNAPGCSKAGRIHQLEGSYNLRDLGGVTTSDGRTVRCGRIFRSEYPGFLEVSGGAGVRELGLASVVDLRRRAEAELELVLWSDHGVDHRRIPLSAGGETSWHAKYHAYLTYRPDAVVAAVRRVLDVRAHPVLFHCAAGKDRTGVVAALVLCVLGVDPEHIVVDYVFTEEALEPILNRLLAIDLYAEMLGDDGLEGQRPLAENMRGLLAWLEARGGATKWLVDNGVPTQEIERFRASMLGFGQPL